MKPCPFCFRELYDDVALCPYCGKTQSPPHAVTPARQANTSRLIYTLTPTPPEGYRVNAGEDGKKDDLRKKTEDKLREYHLEFKVRDGAGSRSIPPTLVNIRGKGLDLDGSAAFSSVSARAKKEDLPTVDYTERYDISCAVAQPCTVSTPRPIIYKTTGAKPEQLNDAKLSSLPPGFYLLEYVCTVSDGEGTVAAYSVLFRLRVKKKAKPKDDRRPQTKEIKLSVFAAPLAFLGFLTAVVIDLLSPETAWDFGVKLPYAALLFGFVLLWESDDRRDLPLRDLCVQTALQFVYCVAGNLFFFSTAAGQNELLGVLMGAVFLIQITLAVIVVCRSLSDRWKLAAALLLPQEPLLMLCNDVNTTFNRGATIVLLIVAAIEIMVLGKDVRSSEEPFAPTLRLNAEGRKRIRMALGAAAAFLAFEAGVHLLVRNWF